MPTAKVQFIIDSFKNQVRVMATHCYGSRVLQRIIEYCNPGQIADMYDEIHRDLTALTHDQYGNYVIQNMVEYGRVSDKEAVFATVKKSLAMMSCHKYASNIVEKSLQHVDDDAKQSVIDIILEDDKADAHLLLMMKDKFGNYVIQKLMQIAEGERKVKLEKRLNDYIPVLEKLPYGKHILYALKDEWHKKGDDEGDSDDDDDGDDDDDEDDDGNENRESGTTNASVSQRESGATDAS
jgi:pumilio RNA-binding family